MTHNPNGPRNNTPMTSSTTTSSGIGSATSTYGTTGGTIRTSPSEMPATDATGTIRDRAEQIASTVREKATELGGQVSERANAAVTSMGETMSSVAHQMRDKMPSSIPSSIQPYATR